MRAIVLLFALSACDVDDLADNSDETAELPQHQLPAVFDDGVDWDRITAFEADATMTKAVLAGRAAGRAAHLPVGQGLDCSGALIADDLVVTAAHCKLPGTSFLRMRFGRYGDQDGNIDAGLEDARRRLIQNGMPRSRVDGIIAAGPDNIRNFDCYFIQNDPNRDVAYWRCPGKSAPITIGGVVHDFTLKPGHVFGKMKVRTGTRSAGTDLYAVSQTKFCGDSTFTVALSPGEVTSSSTVCDTGYGTGCFKTWADFTSGSSGGPIVDMSDNTLFGVVHADSLGGPDDCDPRDTSEGFNVGAYLGNGVDQFLVEDLGGNGVSTGSYTGVTATLGAPYTGIPPWTGGGTYYRSCPSRMVAAGLVGTTSSNGGLGNIGLICVPNTEGDATDLRLDRAEVVTAGSWDAGNFGWAGMDYQTFLNEEFGYYQPDLGQHSVASCPPGFYMNGIHGAEDPNMIWGLDCKNPISNQQTVVWLDSSTHGDMGSDYTGDYVHMDCPGDGYIRTLRVHKFISTNEMRGSCYEL